MPYNGLGSEVAWWCPSLQDDSASSTVTDLTTNSYDLTNLNTDATNWVADTDEGGVRAIHLNGTNELHYASSPLDGLVGTEFTLSIWTKKDDTSGGHFLGLYNTGGTPTQQDHHALWHSTSSTYGTSALTYKNYIPSRLVHASNATPNNPTTWRHLVATYSWSGSNVTITLFIDGVQIAQATGAVTINTAMNLAVIGCNVRDNASGRAAFLDGRWDDARVFDSILTQDEITHLATSRGIEGAPVRKEGLGSEVAHWCPSWQDDSAESTITDYTLNGNDLTNFNTDSSNWVADTDNGGVRAVDLNGTDEYHRILDPLVDANTDCTMSIWLKHNAGSAASYGMSRGGDSSAGSAGSATLKYNHHLGFGSGSTPGRINRMELEQTSTIVAANDGTTSRPTTWEHILGTISTSGTTRTLRLYVNGVLTETATGTVADRSFSSFQISGRRFGNGNSLTLLDGRWDDARIFDSILTQDDITHLATSRGIEGAPPPRKEGLGKEVAHWCPSWQDDSAGSTITDYTLNGYDMNPVNMDASNWVADTSEGGVRALDFNGTNEYCQTTLNNVPYSSLDAQLQTSVSIWVYGELTSANGVPWAYAKTQGGFSTRRVGYRLADRGGDQAAQCVFGSQDNSTNAQVFIKTVNGSQPRSTWYHLYAEFEKSAVGDNQNASTRLWIDGVYIGEDSDATNIFDNEPLHRMFLGQNTRTAGNLETTYFNGRLDDIRFFGEHLTQDEITHLASARGVEGSPFVSMLDPSLPFIIFFL